MTGPLMNPLEVIALRELIAELAPKRVLEWGSGYSTIQWATEFPAIEWVAIEHDPRWVKTITPDLPPSARIIQLEFPEYWQPRDMGTFDLIIVDGRERVRCLDNARSYLKPGGTVVLHDAARPRYKPGLAYYATVKEMVPGTDTADPRGLTLARDPLQFLAPAPRPKGTAGAMYICWGAPACDQAKRSITSLRVHLPDFPVVVLGDAETALAFADYPGVEVMQPGVNPFEGTRNLSFMAGRVKPLLAYYSPFERTMYVDADTAFKGSPQLGFDWLDRWDFIIAEAETRSLGVSFSNNQSEASVLANRLGTPLILYHNSGLFFWRSNKVTADLFRLWGDEWLHYSGWDEQLALLRALLASDAIWLNVPYTWNCRQEADAFMVYHRFGVGSSRKFAGAAVEVVGRGRPVPPGRRLVRVEVAPGRFVRVHEGDEEKAIQNFEAQQQGHRRGVKRNGTDR